MKITRRNFIKTTAISLGASTVGGCSLSQLAIANSKDKRPNIVVIFTDDQGYGDLGCYGHPTIKTPNIDAMANDGIRFTDFYSTSSVCSPSRAALLTGRYPIRTGVTRVFFPHSKGGLPKSETTIAQLLKSNYYSTTHIGKWHLGIHEGSRPQCHGFDYTYGLPYSNDMAPREGVDGDTKRLPHPPVDGWNVPLMRNGEILECPAEQATLTKRYTEESIRFIQGNKDKPFFLYLAHTMPHTPVFASEDFKGRSLRGVYGDVIEEIDWSTGEILKTLKENNLDKNTLVFYTSDNGPWLSELEQGGSAGLLRGGKMTTWEGGMRVPAIAWMPERIKPAVISEQASTLDLFPTIASISGCSLIDEIKLDGIDLSPVLFDGEKIPERAFFYYRLEELFACRLGKWKAHFLTQGGGGTGSIEDKQVHNPPLLYNLYKDPSEKFNRSKENPEIIKLIENAVEKHKTEIVIAKRQ